MFLYNLIIFVFVIIMLSAVIGYVLRVMMSRLLPLRWSRIIASAPVSAVFGMFVIFLYAIAVLFAPWIAPYGESEVIGSAFQLADKNMILGGDQLGRDMFSRLVYGARNSVGISFVSTTLAFLIGSTLGMFAALKGGWVDQVIGRSVDVVMSIPPLIFALLLLSILGPSIVNIILIVVIIYTPVIYRLSRAVAGDIVAMDYIEAAKLRGENTSYLMMREILPNALVPLSAEFGLRFCFVFLLIAGLSFLGLGIQPPSADWGSMVRENATLISYGELTPLIPATAIALLTVSINFVIDWVSQQSTNVRGEDER